MEQMLRVSIVGDTSKLNRALSQSSARLKNFGAKLTGIGSRLSTRVTLPLALAGGAAVKSASDFERLRTSLNVLTGSAEEGSRAFERLVQFSAKTPFQLSDLAAVNNQLIGFGMSTDEAFNSLKLLGDVSAIAGADLTRVAVAFGQSSAAGRIMQQDINQFINNGIPIYKILNSVTGASVDELRKMGSEGKLSFDLLRQGFQKATSEGGQFENGMQKLSGTFAGQFSTLKDNLNIALAEFGKILLPLLNKAMSSLTKLLRSFKNFDAETKRLVITLGLVAAALPIVVTLLGGLLSAIAVLTSPITLTVAGVVALGVALYEAMPFLDKFSITIKTALLNGLVRVQEAFGKFTNNLRRLKELFKEFIKNKFDADFDSINDKFNNLNKEIGDNADAQIEANKATAENLKGLVQYPSILGAVTNAVKSVSNAMLGFSTSSTEATEAIKKTATAATEGLKFDPDSVEFIDFDEINLAKDFHEEIEKMVKDAEFAQERLKIVNEGIKVGLVGAVSALGSAIATGENPLASLATSMLSTVGGILQQLGAAAIAASNIATTFAVPIVGVAAGLAAIALGSVIQGIAGSIQNKGIPSFANGGIVSAPTLAMVGDNFGASRGNPEVISPLNKLQSMIGGRDVNVSGQFRLEGQDLVVALQRANRNRSRLI